MINIYDSRKNGRMKVFLVLDEHDNVTSSLLGNNAVATGKGIQFYLDDYVADQLDKFRVSLEGTKPIFELMDGESLIIPTEEQEKQREIEELEKRLKELTGAE